jgi:hypothetical protein
MAGLPVSVVVLISGGGPVTKPLLSKNCPEKMNKIANR